MLKIRQSYHGIGGAEGYVWKVYDANNRKIGELKYVSPYLNVEDTVTINGMLYIVTKIYDSDNPRHEKTEVIFYELELYEYKPDFDLGWIEY